MYFTKELFKIVLTIITKNKRMEKQLKLDDVTARRLYPTAAPEFKELLEQNFGKEFFNQKARDTITGYGDILNAWGVNESADNVKVEGFDDAENNVVKAFIQKMRTSKIYRAGKLPKVGDKRWYPWWRVSSGFVFDDADCADTGAYASSASRLSFLEEADVIDYAMKFKDIEQALIDLK